MTTLARLRPENRPIAIAAGFVLVILLGVALLVWIPFRRSVTGRTVYAIGSAEGAAYMSGLPIAPPIPPRSEVPPSTTAAIELRV